MQYQSIFKRYEYKYLITKGQKTRILEEIESHMQADDYGVTTIRNLYFDTDNYRLIRRSIEKPVYKEKLRVRSYNQARQDSPVFVELKKKYQSVVYKRRLLLPENEAMSWLCQNTVPGEDSQIAREIGYALHFYKNLHPVLFLSYDREAYYEKAGGDFRVTFDENIRCRQERLSLRNEADGEIILGEDLVLMELKCSGGIPLWMTGILTKEKIYKTSFSKYGRAYQEIIYPRLGGKVK